GAGLLGALGVDRSGTESEIPAVRQFDGVVQAGSGDVGVRVGGLVDHGRLPLLVVAGVAGGHGVLLVGVLVGGDGVVWLGLAPGLASGATQVVGVGLAERLSGDRVELGVLVRQGVCG